MSAFEGISGHREGAAVSDFNSLIRREKFPLPRIIFPVNASREILEKSLRDRGFRRRHCLRDPQNCDFPCKIPCLQGNRAGDRCDQYCVASQLISLRNLPLFGPLILKTIQVLILKRCLLFVRHCFISEAMRKPFSRRRQHALRRLLRVTGVALLCPMRRQCAPLSVGQLCLFQLSHAAMTTRIQGEVCRQPEFLRMRCTMCCIDDIANGLATSPRRLCRIIGMPRRGSFARISSASS